MCSQSTAKICWFQFNYFIIYERNLSLKISHCVSAALAVCGCVYGCVCDALKYHCYSNLLFKILFTAFRWHFLAMMHCNIYCCCLCATLLGNELEFYDPMTASISVLNYVCLSPSFYVCLLWQKCELSLIKKIYRRFIKCESGCKFNRLSAYGGHLSWMFFVQIASMHK